MIEIPDNYDNIYVEGATVDFITFTVDETTYFMFDTSKCAPPEPMVNAMAGLRLLDSANKKLVMINHKSPGGLLDKIGNDFATSISKTQDGLVEIIFSAMSFVDMNNMKYQSARC
jgi:hypothetical protein